MIGEKLSAVLEEIEDTLWEFEFYESGNPNYTINGFRASIKIFMSALMDKMWELQKEENMDMETRTKMVIELGEKVRELVKIYTNIDTHELYKGKF